jgi:RNA binding exosome subunit
VDKERADPPVGILHIPGAEARIDENKAVAVRLDKQAVADQLPRQATADTIPKLSPDRTHAAAIEMMNAHGGASLK